MFVRKYSSKYLVLSGIESSAQEAIRNFELQEMGRSGLSV